MIETNHDPEVDVLHVSFGAPNAVYDGPTEVAHGVYLEFGADGHPIGIEVTGVRNRAGQIADRNAA